ncbi:MAG: cell division protein ZapA [Cocleimonas sp.]|nr:cell division protein ZapA [Cocleimonas sp.]
MSDEKEATQNSSLTPVAIRILGKDYTIACPSGAQRSLISSAKEVDDKMREIRKSGKIIGSERIAVITALNLAHELNFANEQSSLDDEIIQRINKLQKKITSTLNRINSKS